MASPEVSTLIAQEPKKSAQGRSFQNILDFLAEATPTPTDLRTPWPPRQKNQTEKMRQRNFIIAGRFLGTDDPLEEIGNGYNLTRERIRQIVKKVVEDLHKISIQEVQEAFPIESFDFDKSHTLEGRKRKSQVMGGRSFKVDQLVTQGKSAPEIRDTLGITSQSLYAARQTLKGWGIEVPTRKDIYHKKLEELQNPDLSDTEAQEILDAITRSGYRELSRGEKPVLTPVSIIARGAGLLFTTRDIKRFFYLLKKSGIPASSVARQKTNKNAGRQVIVTSYYFIRSLDTDRAAATLKQSSV